MSAQLSSIQKILQKLGIDAYLRSQSADRPLATLGVEIETGAQESNLLEICEIPIPDSDLFLLQWFVQLPLSEPFSPSDCIPEFQLLEVLTFCAEINQILPVGIFNVFQQQLCFRHIFSCEFLSVEQVEYLLQTIEGTIQRIQPMLQSVAIGSLTAEEAIASIDTAFSEPEASDTIQGTIQSDEVVLTDSNDLSQPTPSLESLEDLETPQRFSIDDIANMKINIEEEEAIDGWTDNGAPSTNDGWDLSDDFVVFDEDSTD